MAGLGILIAWSGYSVLYYGLTQIQGGNWGYLDMVIPSRWTATVAATPKDGGGGTQAQRQAAYNAVVAATTGPDTNQPGTGTIGTGVGPSPTGANPQPIPIGFAGDPFGQQPQGYVP
jgi:hypothetical protein